MGVFISPAKLSPSVRPGQVVSYNGWEPYTYRTWKGASDVEPGMVKWLHFAGGDGHLGYWPLEWARGRPAPGGRLPPGCRAGLPPARPPGAVRGRHPLAAGPPHPRRGDGLG